MKLVHRIVYEAKVGPIPKDYVLDHVYERCTSRACVEPSHLEPVTVAENNRRMFAAGRGYVDGWRVAVAARVAKQAAQTECLRGHPLDAENTRIDSRGRRSCKACAADQQRERRALRKAA